MFAEKNWISVLGVVCALLSRCTPKGRTATQRSKKGSEKVLDRVLGKGSQKGSEKGVCYGFYSEKGFCEGFSEAVLRRGFPEGA